MVDSNAGQVRHRDSRSRVGITALNLIAPGLGLIRLGDWRAGAFFLLIPFAAGGLLTFGVGHLPITSYGRALSALILILGLFAAIYVVPAVLTWRKCRFYGPVQGWSRWYGLTAIAIATMLLSRLVSPLMLHFYKPFYSPSESMAPTIGKGDRFLVDMRWRGPVKRGDIVVFMGRDSIRISRAVAIGGDRIAMRDGVPILNGSPVDQRAQGDATFVSYDGLHDAAMLIERLPGEKSAHRVLDTGPSQFDNMREVLVPLGHFFVLGDNRDRAADSRVPAELAGAGMVPLTAIVGRPLYIHWSSDRGAIGTRLDQ